MVQLNGRALGQEERMYQSDYSNGVDWTSIDPKCILTIQGLPMPEEDMSKLQKYVLKTHANLIQNLSEDIQELKGSVSKNRSQIEDVRVEIAKLGVKSSVWSAIGSAIPIFITIVILFLSHKI